jgi:AcrR family transcriptional regulator
MAEIKVGRPREFDVGDALDAAIEVFWAKGYDGASLTDLTEALGITRPSLYAAFKDKRGLYLASIAQYMASEECPPLVAFDSEKDIRRAVRAFLSSAVDYATSNDKQRGCFLGACVATSCGEVDGVEELLRQAITEMDKRLAARFEMEKEAGNLPQDFPSVARARLMFDLRQGYALRARAGISARQLKSDLKSRVGLVIEFGKCVTR